MKPNDDPDGWTSREIEIELLQRVGAIRDVGSSNNASSRRRGRELVTRPEFSLVDQTTRKHKRQRKKNDYCAPSAKKSLRETRIRHSLLGHAKGVNGFAHCRTLQGFPVYETPTSLADTGHQS